MSEKFQTAIWPREMVLRMIEALKADGHTVEKYHHDFLALSGFGENERVVFIAHEHGTRYAVELNLAFFSQTQSVELH